LTNPTEAATFRLDKLVLYYLRREAESKQVSLSTLLNQVARAHVEWHANATSAGFMPIRRKVVKAIFDPLTKEQIDSLASDVSRGLVDETMMIMLKERTEESILELFERWIKFSGFNYHYETSSDSTSRIFVIQHNMGEKWSYYLSKLIENVAADFTSIKPESQVTENALFIRIRKAW
jgi:hypothetical protein